MVAPWCLTTYASGYSFILSIELMNVTRHTFPPGGETFLPYAEFNVNRITFPACLVGDTVFQTVQLRNSGDTPVKFFFAEDHTSHFSLKPNRGVLKPNQHQLIIFKFSPSEQKKYYHTFRV
jgi:hypothetical protein